LFYFNLGVFLSNGEAIQAEMSGSKTMNAAVARNVLHRRSEMAGSTGAATDMQQVQILHDRQRFVLLRSCYGRFLRLNLNNHG